MLKGSCLCKAVTYTLDEELSELVFCHCSFCRKATLPIQLMLKLVVKS